MFASVLIYYIAVLLPSSSQGENYTLSLTSDGPALMYAPITFTGKLVGATSGNEASWWWEDNVAPSHTHWNQTILNSTVVESNFTLTYNNSGDFTMTLVVCEYPEDLGSVATASVDFKITEQLNGEIVITQDNGNGTWNGNGTTGSVVSTVRETNVSLVFYDPSDYLSEANSINYYWYINPNQTRINTKVGTFAYNFTKPGIFTIEAFITASFDSFTRSGYFQSELIAKQPVSSLVVAGYGYKDGSVLLKHGQLVDLNITCNGTADWSYCWSIQNKSYVITGNETCTNVSPVSQGFLKSKCSFPILYYFKKSDTYNLLVQVSNDVSNYREVIPVTIYDKAATNFIPLKLAVIIIPVVSIIVGIMMIMFGIGLYSKYKSRLEIEVADFDFGCLDEDELQIMTFWERLRESFLMSIKGKEIDNGLRRHISAAGSSEINYERIT